MRGRMGRTDGPDPLGTLMVIPTLGYTPVVRVVRIVVVSYWYTKVKEEGRRRRERLTSVRAIPRIQSLDTERTNEVLLVTLESEESMRRFEQLWSDGHGDGKVGSELVVAPFSTVTGSDDVLVDTATGYI